MTGPGVCGALIGAGRRHTSARFVSTTDYPATARLGEAYPEVIQAEAARVLEALEVDVVHDHTLAGVLLAYGRRRSRWTWAGPRLPEGARRQGPHVRQCVDPFHVIKLATRR